MNPAVNRSRVAPHSLSRAASNAPRIGSTASAMSPHNKPAKPTSPSISGAGARVSAMTSPTDTRGASGAARRVQVSARMVYVDATRPGAAQASGRQCGPPR